MSEPTTTVRAGISTAGLHLSCEYSLFGSTESRDGALNLNGGNDGRKRFVPRSPGGQQRSVAEEFPQDAARIKVIGGYRSVPLQAHQERPRRGATGRVRSEYRERVGWLAECPERRLRAPRLDCRERFARPGCHPPRAALSPRHGRARALLQFGQKVRWRQWWSCDHSSRHEEAA